MIKTASPIASLPAARNRTPRDVIARSRSDQAISSLENDMANYRRLYPLVTMVMLFILSCAVPNAPRFQPLAHRDGQATLDDLKRDWENYSTSYGGGSVGLASALIFDPKDDDRCLVGNGYITVSDKETLQRVISTIESYATFTPTVYKIYGPDEGFYGFVFTAFYRPLPNKVDDRTLSLPNWKSQSYIGGP